MFRWLWWSCNNKKVNKIHSGSCINIEKTEKTLAKGRAMRIIKKNFVWDRKQLLFFKDANGDAMQIQKEKR